MGQNNAIELRNVTKRFGAVVANNDVSMDVRRGEILSLLGENGSGKTTLMNMIAGIYFPDEGEIFIDGKEVVIRSPQDAYKYHIGMIHQHFKLIDIFTAADNVILGEKMPPFSIREKSKEYKDKLDDYGIVVDADDERSPVKEFRIGDKPAEKIKCALKCAALPFVKLGKKSNSIICREIALESYKKSSISTVSISTSKRKFTICPFPKNKPSKLLRRCIAARISLFWTSLPPF